MPSAFAAIIPVAINDRTEVIGFDIRVQQPILDRGDGPVAMSDVQRGAWEAGKEAFTPSEEATIEKSIAHWRRGGPEETRGYNPNQPRDPAGSPTGGQFASGGGESSVVTEEDKASASTTRTARPRS